MKWKKFSKWLFGKKFLTTVKYKWLKIYQIKIHCHVQFYVILVRAEQNLHLISSASQEITKWVPLKTKIPVEGVRTNVLWVIVKICRFFNFLHSFQKQLHYCAFKAPVSIWKSCLLFWIKKLVFSSWISVFIIKHNKESPMQNIY